MPRKSKDELKNNNVIETKTKKTSTKRTTKKVNSEDTKIVSKKTATKKQDSKVTDVASDTKKQASKTSTKQGNKTTKTQSTKTASKRKTARTSKTQEPKKAISSVEYYDLPYRYNETAVRILAQTPTMLFIYWNISDADRNSYIEKYGDDFFNKTKPVLIVRNKTMNYTFEVEINDFANSWYLHVNDADCDYSVELGRKPISYDNTIDDYVYVTTSNDMEMPNNHILLDRLGKSVFFRNIKNNFVEEKDFSSLSFMRNLGKVYDIYELYKEMYKDEINEELNETLHLNLSSSSSSTFM